MIKKMRKWLAVLVTLSMLVSMIPFAAAEELGAETEPPAVEQPADPNPEAPAETGTPEAPAETGTPEAPAETGTPETPAETGTPEAPAETGTPDLPTETGAPELPTETGTPELPTETGTPELPTETGTPELPAETGTPELPAETGAPEIPGTPLETPVPLPTETPVVTPIPTPVPVPVATGIAFVSVYLDGEALEGAEVTLEETGDTATTDDTGLAKFTGLEAGTYSVYVEYDLDGETLTDSGLVTIGDETAVLHSTNPMQRSADVGGGVYGAVSLSLNSVGQRFWLVLSYQYEDGRPVSQSILSTEYENVKSQLEQGTALVVNAIISDGKIAIQLDYPLFSFDSTEYSTTPLQFQELEGSKLQTCTPENKTITFKFGGCNEEQPDTSNYTLIYKNNEPQGTKANFFIRIDGGFVPLENGNTGYTAGLYAPMGIRDNKTYSIHVPEEYGLGGRVEGKAVWTEYFGKVENGKVKGQDLMTAFSAVASQINEWPDANDIALSTAHNGVTFDPETQQIYWYVIKNQTNCGCYIDDGKKEFHVDGIIGDINAEYVLQYFGNAGNDSVTVPGLSLHANNATASIEFDGVSRNGYNFLGWSEDPEAETPEYTKNGTNTIKMSGDKYLYAVWQKIPVVGEYTVTYKWYGDTVPKGVTLPGAKIYKAGDSVTVAGNPTADYWTFKGWEIEQSDVNIENGVFTMPDHDVTITGEWTQNKVDVQFWHYYGENANPEKYDNQTIDPILQSSQEINGAYVSRRIVDRDGYRYSTTEIEVCKAGGTAFVPAELPAYGGLALKDITAVRIHFTYNELYSVTYEPGEGVGDAVDGGSRLVNEKYTVLESLPDGITAKEHFQFDGWALKDDPSHSRVTGEQTQPKSNVIYVAQYKEDPKYTVTYKISDAPDAKTYSDKVERYEGAEYTVLPGLNDAGFGRLDDNMYFTGWKLVQPSEGVATSGTAQQPAENVVYVAQYAPYETYTVVYNAGNGGVGKDVSLQYFVGDSFSVLDNGTNGRVSFSNPNHTFVGWSNTDGHETEPGKTVEGGLADGKFTTYVAQWKANDYEFTVRYYNDSTGEYIGEPSEGTAPFGDKLTDSAAVLLGADWQTARMPDTGYKIASVENAEKTIGGAADQNVITVHYELESYPYVLRYYNATTKADIGDVVSVGTALFGETIKGTDVTALRGEGWQNARMPANYKLLTISYPRISDGLNEVVVTYEEIQAPVVPPVNPPVEPPVNPPVEPPVDGGDDDDDGPVTPTIPDGGNDNDTTPPGDTIPDNQLPLGPDAMIPDAQLPLGPEVPAAGSEVEITDGELPLGSIPEEEDGDEVTIIDEETPLGNLPQTGTMQNASRTLGMLALLASMAAAGLALVTGRKKNDEI